MATSYWNSNGGDTDQYGFSALSGGYDLSGGYFSNVGDGGSWWTVTENNSNLAYGRGMYYNLSYMGPEVNLHFSNDKISGDWDE